MLWVLGSSAGIHHRNVAGARIRQCETYQKGLRAAREQKKMANDPLTPSWGEPEILMNLAWSNLNRSTPDPPSGQ